MQRVMNVSMSALGILALFFRDGRHIPGQQIVKTNHIIGANEY